MKPRRTITPAILAIVLVPALAFAQVNFTKHNYYVGMGDSVAAGEGAMPVTNGYVYRLYSESVFGMKKEMDFSNMGTRGARSWDLRDHQVAQVLCASLSSGRQLSPSQPGPTTSSGTIRTWSAARNASPRPLICCSIMTGF